MVHRVMLRSSNNKTWREGDRHILLRRLRKMSQSPAAWLESVNLTLRTQKRPVNAKRRAGISWFLRCGIVLGAVSLAGCEKGPAEVPNKPQEMTNVTILNISKSDDGIETRVGKLVFENGKEPVLSTEGAARDTEALRNVWQEIKKSDELPVPTTVR